MSAQIEYRQVCSEHVRAVRYIDFYHQTFDGKHGIFTCSCNTSNCKHIMLFKENLCDWTEMYSDAVQTEENKCPQCGKETVIIKVTV